MKILGLDLGTKTLGVAVTDSLLIAAYPVKTFTFKRNDFEAAKDIVVNLMEEYETNEIAIGNPLHLSGEESEMSKNVKNFIEMLKSTSKTPIIHLIDERFSTISAMNYLHEMNKNSREAKAVIDAMSAQIILETYLQQRKIEKEKENEEDGK